MEEKNIPPDGTRAFKRIVVCGPPGAGKSRYVSERARYGDVVLDFDELFATVSRLPLYNKPRHLIPVVLAMRDAALQATWELYTGATGIVWVIALAPRAEQRTALARGGKVIVIECDVHECIRRIGLDERRVGTDGDAWFEIVSDWWNQYEKREGDEVVVLQ